MAKAGGQILRLTPFQKNLVRYQDPLGVRHKAPLIPLLPLLQDGLARSGRLFGLGPPKVEFKVTPSLLPLPLHIEVLKFSTVLLATAV